MAPGSSGLGKATVGKSGSGSACSVTGTGAGNPARAKAAASGAAPTPCSAVWTVVAVRAEPGARTPAARSRYASTTASSSTVPPPSLRGTESSAPIAAIRAAISRSAGSTIWLPSPR